jgi:hypothetical protein
MEAATAPMALGAPTGAQAAELGVQVGSLRSRRRPGALDQGGLQPRRPLSHAGGPALAGALVILGTKSGPGDQMAFGREPPHVDADLGGDDLGAELADARDRA